MSRRLRAVALVLLAAVATTLGTVTTTAPPAAAHNYVVSSDPEADQTRTEPVSTVSLEFNDAIVNLGGGSALVLDVTDAAGAHYVTDCPAALDRTLSAPATLGGPGTYTVTWRIVSADGHPVSGSYTFDYAPADGGDPAAGTPQAACGADGGAGGAAPEPEASGPAASQPAASEPAADRADAADEAAGEGSDEGSDEGTDPAVLAALVGLGVLVVAGGAVGAALLVLRRRR